MLTSIVPSLWIHDRDIDIRTLYILFILSFVDTTAPTSLKVMFLEQRTESLVAVFKGLGQDPYSVVRLVLEKLWGGLWSDTKLKKTLKIGLFNETVLSHVRKILAFFDNPVRHLYSSTNSTCATSRMRGMYRKTSPRTLYTTFFSLSPRILGPEFASGTTGGTAEKKALSREATEKGTEGFTTKF